MPIKPVSAKRGRRRRAQSSPECLPWVAGELIERCGSWLFPALLAFATLVAFLPTLDNGFVNWDDDRNFLDNPDYRGLGWRQVHWMLTTLHMGHYIPLTWLTLGLDYVLWGLDPAGYHLINLLLHATNAVLFYFVSARLLARAATVGTGELGVRLGAIAAALLFALHPLRVEAVAWATERRELLCSLFYLLAILAYLGACEEAPEGRLHAEPRYWASLGFFALALLSKSMAVSLPAVLLVLDVYPLRRLAGRRGDLGWLTIRRVAIEKAPFALLSLAASVVAVLALNQNRGIRPVAALGWPERAAISLYSLGFYLWKSLLPLHLSPLYELPERIDLLAWPYLGAAVVVAALTAAAIALRRRWPALPAVWTNYVIILLPVLGIVQNGPQIAADRYTYLASMGWAVLAGAAGRHWWVAQGPRRLGRAGALATAWLAAAVIGGLGFLTWNQVTRWHDSESLWRHAASASPSSGTYFNWGVSMLERGDFAEAESHFRQALRFRPGSADTLVNLGNAAAQQGKSEEAVEHFRQALAINPADAAAHNNLGHVLAGLARLADAAGELREALRLDPDLARAHANLAAVLARQGHWAEATQHFSEASRLQAESSEARRKKRDDDWRDRGPQPEVRRPGEPK